LVVADLFAHQFDLKGGQIIRKDHAIAVQNQSAARGNRFGAHAVAQREFGKVIVPQHL
jgi:hypothetical protein